MTGGGRRTHRQAPPPTVGLDDLIHAVSSGSVLGGLGLDRARVEAGLSNGPATGNDSVQ